MGALSVYYPPKALPECKRSESEVKNVYEDLDYWDLVKVRRKLYKELDKLANKNNSHDEYRAKLKEYNIVKGLLDNIR